jgi:hypothetical protein
MNEEHAYANWTSYGNAAMRLSRSFVLNLKRQTQISHIAFDKSGPLLVGNCELGAWDEYHNFCREVDWRILEYNALAPYTANVE